MLLNYNSSNIKILKGLEAVRKRPGMYIGDTYDGTGLHHMVFEVIDNSIDEALAGFCKNIVVKIHNDNSISVFDDGRGIPIDIHKTEGISAAELIMTMLHTGGKFDNNSYKISGGLHGVGISVVNALSEKLKLKVYKYNKIFFQCYKYGKPLNKISVIGKTNYNGTYIRFWPDKYIFNNYIKFKYSILFKRLNELSFLNCGLNINLIDKRNNKSVLLKNKGGLKSFLNYLVKDKYLINKNIFYFKRSKKNFLLEIACCWLNNSNCSILCFTNNIPQIDGGTHLIGFKSAITRTINFYINNEYLKKKNKFNIIGKDSREGLYALISVKFSNPKFSSQTKDKLISSEIKSFVESLVIKNLYDFLLENPIEAKLIINKIINSYKIRQSIKKFREISKKKSNLDLSNISNKLSDCQEKNYLYSEIFLVEGDSAGGSAKQGRNRLNQAVLPLKGKIINVEKNNLDKILSSNEINILISVLGCGIDYNDDFNIKKLRYNKIIIMTDADVDGSHIRTLLLTFFYRYMKQLIINGHLYIARPPLYRIKNNNKDYYINNEKNLLKYKIIFNFKNVNIYKDNNLIILKYKKLIKIILIYIKIFKNCLNNKYKLKIFLLNKLMIFRNINIEDINFCNIWLNDFIYFINKNDLNIKINCKIIKENNIFYGIKFKLINKYFIKKYFFNKKFFIKKYIKIINLGKKLFFLKNNKKFFILLNNEKFYFYNIIDLINLVLKKNINKVYIQHYKGLGEMNPKQLWNTTMNPNNRFLFKIYLKDLEKTDNLFKILMGDNVKLRKSFIKENYKNINNINI